jgi:hypothetical protein
MIRAKWCIAFVEFIQSLQIHFQIPTFHKTIIVEGLQLIRSFTLRVEASRTTIASKSNTNAMIRNAEDLSSMIIKSVIDSRSQNKKQCPNVNGKLESQKIEWTK